MTSSIPTTKDLFTASVGYYGVMSTARLTIAGVYTGGWKFTKKSEPNGEYSSFQNTDGIITLEWDLESIDPDDPPLISRGIGHFEMYLNNVRTNISGLTNTVRTLGGGSVIYGERGGSGLAFLTDPVEIRCHIYSDFHFGDDFSDLIGRNLRIRFRFIYDSSMSSFTDDVWYATASSYVTTSAATSQANLTASHTVGGIGYYMGSLWLSEVSTSGSSLTIHGSYRYRLTDDMKVYDVIGIKIITFENDLDTTVWPFVTLPTGDGLISLNVTTDTGSNIETWRGGSITWNTTLNSLEVTSDGVFTTGDPINEPIKNNRYFLIKFYGPDGTFTPL